MAALNEAQARKLLNATTQTRIISLVTTGDTGNIYISRMQGTRDFAMLSQDSFDGIKLISPNAAAREIVRLTEKGWDADLKGSTNWTASG